MTSTRRASRPPLPPGFGTIWSAVAVDLVGFGIVLPILPLYSERFGASPVTIGLLVASFSLAQVLLAPVLGRLSDRVGRKPVLVGSMVGTAVGSLLTALAPGLWFLFLGRIIDGASGASVSVAHAAVTDIAVDGQRARLLGLISAAFGLGFVVGPAIGSLAALGGPRVPFLVAAALAGTNAVVAQRRLPETRAARTRSTADPAALSIEGRGTSPALVRLLVIGFFSTCAFSAFEATFALLGARRFGLDLGSAAAVFGGAGLVVALSSAGLVHVTVQRMGEAATVRFGLLLVGTGLVGIAVAGSWWVLAPALGLLAAGQGLIAPSLAAAVSRSADADRRGSALGAQHSAGGLARIVGPVVGGLAFELGGPAVPMALAALLASLAAALVRPVGPVTHGRGTPIRPADQALASI